MSHRKVGHPTRPMSAAARILRGIALKLVGLEDLAALEDRLTYMSLGTDTTEEVRVAEHAVRLEGLGPVREHWVGRATDTADLLDRWPQKPT